MDAKSSVEFALKHASIWLLIGAGIFFIVEGAILVDTYNSNPTKVSKKLVTAGTLSIILGIASIFLAALHHFLDMLPHKS